jgi:hypothetical protein
VRCSRASRGGAGWWVTESRLGRDAGAGHGGALLCGQLVEGFANVKPIGFRSLLCRFPLCFVRSSELQAEPDRFSLFFAVSAII